MLKSLPTTPPIPGTYNAGRPKEHQRGKYCNLNHHRLHTHNRSYTCTVIKKKKILLLQEEVKD